MRPRSTGTGPAIRCGPITSSPSARRSADLEWRFDQYPLFREFSGLWGEHDGQVILDYGCGPGNDLTGFADPHRRATRLIGIDVSADGARARRQAARRFTASTPTASSCCAAPTPTRRSRWRTPRVDHVQTARACSTTPATRTRSCAELAPRAAPRRPRRIMVYNRDSIWLHLYTAYERMIRRGRVREPGRRGGLRSAPPTARSARSRAATRAEDFLGLCRGAGLRRATPSAAISPVRELQPSSASWRRGARRRRRLRRAPRLPARADIRLQCLPDVPRPPRRHRRHVPLHRP